MADRTGHLERRSGVAIWRQVADRIRFEISSGLAAEDGRLPPETALAARFGVNRHTVRSAIAALVREGVLRAEQGRGTFVEKRRRLAYPIGARTRFSSGLAGQARDRHGILLGEATEAAGPEIAQALGLEAQSAVVRLETVAEADGRRVSRATNWFDAERFAGIGKAYARSGSITTAFRELGVADYFRHSTMVTARHADPADLDDLQLSPGAIVLIAAAVNVDAEGRPVQYARTRFAADRVELQIVDEKRPSPGSHG